MNRRQRSLARIGGAALAATTLSIGWQSFAAHAGARGQAVVASDDFEAGAGSWTTLGPTGKAVTTTEAARVKEGKGALEFHYKVEDISGKPTKPGELPVDVLVRPTPNSGLAKMQSLRFWARTDHDTPLLLALTEQGGGRYVTAFWSPKDAWQRVQLAPQDFWLTDDKNDPKDPNNQLDLDKVENISIISLWAFAAAGAGASPEAVAIFQKHFGTHALLLDDFTISAEPLPAPDPAGDAQEGKGLWIDSLRRNLVFWVPFGDLKIQLDASGTPLKSRALRLDYVQEQGKYSALFHDLRGRDLTKMDRLTFETASDKSLKLVLGLEERGGAKYNATVDIPGDRVVTRRAISFGDFQPAEDSPRDPNGQLDLNQLKTLTLVDVTGFFGLGKQKNTLWIGPMRAAALDL